MAKLALCVKRSDIDLAVKIAYTEAFPQLVPIDPRVFTSIDTELRDRAFCETDENYLQLLPYNVIIAPDERIFVYTRGGAGEEARLHGNFSIGVGGHVDHGVVKSDDDELDPDNLLDLLIDEAGREIEEEIGFSAEQSEINFTHFIVDGTNPVGRVHLGLLNIYRLDDEEFETVNQMILEENVIESGRWMTYDELRSEENLYRLENWSRVVIQVLPLLLLEADDGDDEDWDAEVEVTGKLDLSNAPSTFFVEPAGSSGKGYIHYDTLIAALKVQGIELVDRNAERAEINILNSEEDKEPQAVKAIETKMTIQDIVDDLHNRVYEGETSALSVTSSVDTVDASGKPTKVVVTLTSKDYVEPENDFGDEDDL